MPKRFRLTRRFRRHRATVRAGLLAGCLVLPISAYGQQSGVPEPFGITDQPRIAEMLQARTGYEDLSPDRFGTLASPRPTEMGLYLVLRIFRNICLGLERGEPLEAVSPEGFAAYSQSRYLIGPDATERGNSVVLSPTGDIYADEDGGHPAFTLDPRPGGMTCQLVWNIAGDLEPETQRTMAVLLEDWLPFELSLVPAARPYLNTEPALGNVTEWDRACLGRWCPFTASYTLASGWISIETTLNITEIAGVQP